jgi:hypothetical protein
VKALLSFGLGAILGCGDNSYLITGTYHDTYVTKEGTTDVPRDLSSTEISLHSLVDGSWIDARGTIGANGRFEAEGEGGAQAQVLQVGDESWQLDGGRAQGELSLTSVTARRADTELSDDATRLRLQYSSLDPWRDGDQLVVYSPDAGCNFVVYGFAPDPPPAFDATTMDATVEYRRFPAGEYLINGSLGDEAYLIQMRDSISEVGRTMEVVRYGDVVVTQTPGSFETTSGTLRGPDPSAQMDLVFDVPSFVSALPPGEPYDAAVAQLFASIPGDDQQFLEPAVSLYGVIPGRVTAPVSVNAPYIDVFPAEWVWWEAGVQTSKQVVLEGTAPALLYGGLFVHWRAGSGLPDDFVPLPEPAVELDDADWSHAEILSPSPTVSVSQKTSASYRLEVVHVFENPEAEGRLMTAAVTTIESPEPEIFVPTGFVETGEYYVLVVRIVTTPAPGVEQITTALSPLLRAAS